MEKMKDILSSISIPVQTEGKTYMYNVVILDQSGSIHSIKQQAIEPYGSNQRHCGTM